jgi:exodeoxyribonuclease-5
MQLTRGQSEGLKMVERLKRDLDDLGPPKIHVLAGYAGTGKTTLLKKVPEVLGGVPMVVAPTGKAAIRVREATGIAARTIHSWLYDTDEDENSGEISFHRKNPMEITRGEVSVLVIDEASMVPSDLWEEIHDVCSMLHINILLIGDPFQLPPVEKRQSNTNGYDDPAYAPFNLLSPDFKFTERVLLTEIVRQALDNPIIRASMLIRQGQVAKAVTGMPKLFPAQVLEKAAEIIKNGNGALIVHKNETRNRMNLAVREALKKPEHEIAPGEPLLVLQNNYRLQRFNGELVKFENWIDPPGAVHLIKDWIRKQEHRTRFGIAQIETTPLDTWGQAALAVDQVFGRMAHIAQPPITKFVKILYGRSVNQDDIRHMTRDELNRAMGQPLLNANFGYCLTCHKSQGSEWDKVIVCLEPTIRMQTEEGCRWVYTAITRSREECWINLGGPS